MDPVDFMDLIDHIEHRDFVYLIDIMQLVGQYGPGRLCFCILTTVLDEK